MNIALKDIFVDPYSQEPLQLKIFSVKDDKIINGVFFNVSTQAIYPIIKYVPVFIKNHIPVEFYKIYQESLQELANESILNQQLQTSATNYSFSIE